MNWLEMRVRHGIRPLLPVLIMLVILPHHLWILEGMAMDPPPKILFDFEIDDTFLKHGSLLVKQYSGARSGFTCTSFGPPASSKFLRVRKAFSRMPVYTRYQERNLPKDMVGRLFTGSHAHSRSLPRSAPTRFMPRSVTDRATPVREDRNVENAARAPSDPALPIDDARRVSIDNIYQRHSPA
jgi:hypothetical protein